jgi:hypothetical protein
MTLYSPSTQTRPLPPPLRGTEAGTFTEYTIQRRLPDIARRTLEGTDWHAEAASRLAALADDLPYGRLRLLDDPGAPDELAWSAYIAPYLGQTWLEAPWFDVEIYFFRRILEATGYFQPGPGHLRDPYRPAKRDGLAGVLEILGPLCAELEAASPGLSDAGQAHPLSTVRQLPSIQDTLRRLLHTVVWGNQADLSIFPTGGSQPIRPREEQLAAHLLADDAPSASAYLCSRPHGKGRVDFILDNVGLELAYDLLLADFFLMHGLAQTVYLHGKVHPTYVSDATLPDIEAMIAYLEQNRDASGPGDPATSRLGGRLRAHQAHRRLRLCAEDFWTSPLPCWETPVTLRQELSQSGLLISKGDANYRRWLGDRHWDFTTPFADVLAYRPAPVLALRVFKSQVVIGLPSGKAAELDAQEPTWMYNGHWGLIQFAA